MRWASFFRAGFGVYGLGGLGFRTCRFSGKGVEARGGSLLPKNIRNCGLKTTHLLVHVAPLQLPLGSCEHLEYSCWRIGSQRSISPARPQICAPRAARARGAWRRRVADAGELRHDRHGIRPQIGRHGIAQRILAVPANPAGPQGGSPRLAKDALGG